MKIRKYGSIIKCDREILPLFALANTSIQFSSVSFASLVHPVSMGIIVGLLIGKPLGITGFSFLAVKLGMGSLPLALQWKHIAGIGLLGGVGFTISIFMSVIAFEDQRLIDQSKISVLLASCTSGVMGYWYLSRALRSNIKKQGRN